MDVVALDEVIRAQRAYVDARARAYYSAPASDGALYQFVDARVMREIERATGAAARTFDVDSLQVRRLEYGGCVFQAVAGKAD